jgi:hypothetical protein
MLDNEQESQESLKAIRSSISLTRIWWTKVLAS